MVGNLSQPGVAGAVAAATMAAPLLAGALATGFRLLAPVWLDGAWSAADCASLGTVTLHPASARAVARMLAVVQALRRSVWNLTWH